MAERLSVLATLDFGTVAVGAVAVATATLAGVQVGDDVVATPPSGLHADLLTHSAYCDTPHVATVKVRNVGAGAVTDGARQWRVSAYRGGQ